MQLIPCSEVIDRDCQTASIAKSHTKISEGPYMLNSAKGAVRSQSQADNNSLCSG